MISKNSRRTKNIAKQLATQVLKSKPVNYAKVIGLVGKLGSGKTTFIQGFIKALGVHQRIVSPTFIIFRSYQLPITNYRFKKVYHIDLYRIRGVRELTKLGINEILSEPKNIVLIEWADKILRSLPKDAIWVTFEHGNKINERIITVEAESRR